MPRSTQSKLQKTQIKIGIIAGIVTIVVGIATLLIPGWIQAKDTKPAGELQQTTTLTKVSSSKSISAPSVQKGETITGNQNTQAIGNGNSINVENKNR